MKPNYTCRRPPMSEEHKAIEKENRRIMKERGLTRQTAKGILDCWEYKDRDGHTFISPKGSPLQ